MAPLFFLHWKHLLRSRLLLVALLFVILTEVLALRLVGMITLQFDGMIAPLDWRQTLFFGSVLELGAASFLAAACGIWLIPFLHQGSRAQLTYLLPISPVKVTLSYFLLVASVLGVQRLVTFLLFTAAYGFGTVFSAQLPWTAMIVGFLLESVAALSLAYWLAGSTLMLGPVPTFFLGAFVLGFLQLCGSLLRIASSGPFAQVLGSKLAGWQPWYQLFPPFGDLVFDLRLLFNGEMLGWAVWARWGFWLLASAAVFTLFQRAQAARRAQDI